MENNNSNSTKQVLLSVLAVAILVVAVVGVSFAFFTYSRQGTTENTISTGTLVFKYDEPEAGISLTDAVPMADTDAITELVGSGKAFDFTVTSTIKGTTVIGYEINATDATTAEASKKLDPKYVKVRLSSGTDGTTYGTQVLEPVHFTKLTDSTRTTGAKVLATDTVTGTTDGVNVTRYYRLQMWLAEQDADGKTTMMENDYCVQTSDSSRVTCPETMPEDGSITKVNGTNDKTFTIKVNVDAKDQG